MKKKDKIKPEGIQEKRKKGNGVFVKIIVCTILAVVVFLLLNNIQRNMLKEYEKANVVVCKEKVEKQIDITKENAKEYFKVIEVPKNIIPDNAITKLKDVPVGLSVREITEKEMLTKNDIKEQDEYIKDIEKPVITSISIAKIEDAVGGVLRRGDKVDVISIKDGQKTKLLEGIYIESALDATGKKIKKDETDATMLFNVIVDEADANKLKEEVYLGGKLSLVKVNDVEY